MKTKLSDLGPVNGPITGVILKELLRRGIMFARSKRIAFEVNAKAGHGGDMNDVFTDVDTALQMMYLKTIQECFPHLGIIAEEDSFSTIGDAPNAWITIDPLDGTKAFVRRQSHGVGSMVALVIDGVVVSAWVGDINTGEIYGYRPESDKVHRISGFETSEVLSEDKTARGKLSERLALLRDPLDSYSKPTRAVVRKYFRSHQIDGGSIGIWFARLWKREVGALFLPPGLETPWDLTPIVGISQKLGYVFLRRVWESDRFERFDPEITRTKHCRNEEVIVVHMEDLDLLPQIFRR